ncbi:hypothetical protein TNCV_4371181, partial [Trichonephila clavipes]
MALASWVAWLVCRWPSASKVAVRPWTMSVDFHGAENRQWPCRVPL